MKPNPHIAAMAPYALADFSVPDNVRMVSLAQNESLRPPSPVAIEAGRRSMARSAAYPDPDYPELREAIAEVHAIDPNMILCGAGSKELIACITQAFAGPNKRVLTTQYGYALFRNSAEKVSAFCDLAAEIDFTVSVDALLNQVHNHTAICFVANPGNPTGTSIPGSELRRLRQGLPSSVLLVVDQAYGEFSEEAGSLLPDLVERGDTVILRTFSKAYGLASARAGWGLFPQAIGAQVRKLIIPSSMGSVSAAMATAAVRDQDYMRETCVLTIEQRDRFRSEILETGLHCGSSYTNFVLIRFADARQAQSADRVLRQNGIVMRGMAGYGLSHCLRATIGSPSIMSLAIQTLRLWARENIA